MAIDIEVEGDSEEAVALAQLKLVAQAEGKLDGEGGLQGADRKWILDAYAECLEATLGDREVEGDDDDDEDDDEDEGDEDEK
jgi:hypothetical protein